MFKIAIRGLVNGIELDPISSLQENGLLRP